MNKGFKNGKVIYAAIASHLSASTLNIPLCTNVNNNVCPMLSELASATRGGMAETRDHADFTAPSFTYEAIIPDLERSPT